MKSQNFRCSNVSGDNMKFTQKKIISAAMLCASLMTGSAHANMTVYPMAMSLSGKDSGAGTVQVISKTEETQFIKVSIKRVLKPASGEEREEDVANWEGAGLVVSPPKFALPAGAIRMVRVVSLAQPKEEELYRVYFERATLPDEVSASGKKTEGSVSVNLIWGVLVHQLPAVPHPELHRPRGATLSNAGNVRIGLLEIGRCTGSDDSSCQWSPVNRNIYPGGEMNLPALAGDGVRRVKYQVEGMPDVQTKDLAPGS